MPATLKLDRNRLMRPRWLRLLVVLAAAVVLGISSDELPSQPSAVPPMAAVRIFFPEAEKLSIQESGLGGFQVWSRMGNFLGSIVQTSPQSDGIIGYSGPSNTLVAMDGEGKVIGCSLLSSLDTSAHVRDVQQASSFWKQLRGWSPLQSEVPQVDGVSGSTLTSQAIVEGISVRLNHQKKSFRFPKSLGLEEAKSFFPSATRCEDDRPKKGWTQVFDASGSSLGFLLRTSPEADNVRGYRGPTESIIALRPDRTHVITSRLRSSFDTEEYVQRVKDDHRFLATFDGRSLESIAKADWKAEGIEGVSGATQTSYAYVEGIRKRLEAEIEQNVASKAESRRFLKQVLLVSMLIGGIITSSTSLRTHRWWKRIWNVLVVLVLGLFVGELLSIAWLVGWSRTGWMFPHSIAMAAIATVSLAMPWTTRKNLYCQQLCPHGVLQGWLGKFEALHITLPEPMRRWGSRFPAILLAFSFLIGVILPSFELAWVEPFDAWALGWGAFVSFLVAVVGLVASLFVPQAYCRFGCPTGALLKFVGSGGQRDAIRWTDWAGLILTIAAGGWAMLHRSPSMNLEAPSEEDRIAVRPLEPSRSSTQWHGSAFGTTWSIRFRQHPKKEQELRQKVEDELERIEASLSHWRGDSETALFNQSATTNAMDASDEFLLLLEKAGELHRRTDGMFDVTVEPLVDLWGFGPSGELQREPNDLELKEALSKVGFEKIAIDMKSKLVRKLVPELKIDFGALLQGYAVDRVVALLRREQEEPIDFLVDVGGELYAVGEWNIGIEDPKVRGKWVATTRLSDAALATSGWRQKPVGNSEAAAHHFISPLTGKPVEAKWLSCSVHAERCLDADGLATACMLSDPQRVIERGTSPPCKAWLIDLQGNLQTVPLSNGSQVR